jgi:hypothetical protein
MRPRPPASPSPHRQPRNPRKPSTVRNGQRGSLHPRQQPVPRLLGDAVSSLQVDLLMVRVEDVSLPGYGASQVTRLVVQNRVAMSVAEAATTIG